MHTEPRNCDFPNQYLFDINGIYAFLFFWDSSNVFFRTIGTYRAILVDRFSASDFST